MNFFEHQDLARRKTGRLVVLFALAVLSVIVLTYGLAIVIGMGLQNYFLSRGREGWPPMHWWEPKVLMLISLATVGVVSMGSLYKIAQLRGGGRIVAEGLGGRLLMREAAVHDTERRVLNIVEEMSIASGVPTPPVYVMDREVGINAFAAGYSPGSAVIGVTKGLIESMNRDELQGVIAHEFSHILNGDMRLNIRLVGVVHGILVVSMLGETILRFGWHSGGSNHARRGKDDAPLVFIGFGLLLIGGIGALFGSLIKASVSRQREYLADASAVQFTRNPEGIGNALKVIGGAAHGARVRHPLAAEAAHMFFGQAITHNLAQLFATHPPLPTRIRRIDPKWDGQFIHRPTSVIEEPAQKPVRNFRSFPGPLGALDPGSLVGAAMASADRFVPAIDLIGAPTEAHRQYAAELRDAIPEVLAEPAHETYGARAVVYCLLLSRAPGLREQQLAGLQRSADAAVYELTLKLLRHVDQMDERLRLPLIDIAIGTLTNLSPTQLKSFIDNVAILMKADQRISLFEWCLWRILRRHLREYFGKAKPRIVQYYALARLHQECSTLLAIVALAGHDDFAHAQRAFALGARALPKVELSWPAHTPSLDVLGRALDKLVEVNHKLKHDLLRACGIAVAADHEVTVAEAEIMRAIADTLECPMPPVLPGQPLVAR